MFLPKPHKINNTTDIQVIVISTYVSAEEEPLIASITV